MNDSFREEFSGVRAFKFFTQTALDDVKEMTVKNNQAIERQKIELKNLNKYFEDFTENNKDSLTNIKDITRDIRGIKTNHELKNKEVNDELNRLNTKLLQHEVQLRDLKT